MAARRDEMTVEVNMPLLISFRRWVGALCVAFGVVGATGVVAMMVLVTTDVVTRAVTIGVLGVYEMVEFAMVVAVCSAFGVAQVHKFHVRVDVLVALLPARARAALDCVNGVLMLTFIATVAWMGYSQTLRTRADDLISTLLRIPRWPFELWLSFGWSLLFLAVLADFLLDLARALGKDVGPQPQVHESTM